MKIQGIKKGSLVLTADLKCMPIENIDVGDLVIGLAFGSRYLKFVETRVLKKIEGENYVYRIKSSDGDVCSTREHIWLSDDSRLRNTYRFIPGQFLRHVSSKISPIETNDYKVGYIAGSYDGDGYISDKYRMAKLVGDYEMMDETLKYSNELGFGLRETYYNGGKFALDSCIITTKANEKDHIRHIIEQGGNDDYKKGYLAGIYDAEGGFDMTLRFYNNNERILNRVAEYLHHFGFETEFDIMRSECAIRILGGTKKFLDFLILVNPKSENKKKYIFDTHFKFKKFSMVSGLISCITFENKIVDVYNLETTSDNFVADGFVCHGINIPDFISLPLYKSEDDVQIANNRIFSI